MPDDPMTIRYPVRRIVRTTPKIVARGRMESRSVGMKFVEPPPRHVLRNRWQRRAVRRRSKVDRRGRVGRRATYAVGKIQQTGAETAFFHMGSTPTQADTAWSRRQRPREDAQPGRAVGNELPQYPAGWGPELRAAPFPFHWSYLCRTRAGFDTTEPYFASITDAGGRRRAGRRSGVAARRQRPGPGRAAGN